MFNIKNIEIETPTVSKLNPVQLQFKENSTRRTWDLIETSDAVGIIVYNTSSKKLIAVKRFEPAVYLTAISNEDKQMNIDMLKYPEDLGIVLELCGSNLKVTNDEHVLQVIESSICESTGYKVSREFIEFVSCFKSDVGPKCGNIYVYYCEVDNKMKGNCIHKPGEFVVELTVSEIKEYLQKSLPERRSSPIFLYGMLWFIREKQ